MKEAKMRAAVKFICVGMLLFCSNCAFALGSISGPINSVISVTNVDGTGVFAVRVTGTYTTPPACATNASLNQFSVSTEKHSGRVIIATLLSAQAAGKTVGIQGAGTCNLSAGSEDIYYIYDN
jgi:hypothetical protein